MASAVDPVATEKSTSTAGQTTRSVSAIQLIRDYIARQTEEDSPLSDQLSIKIAGDVTYGNVAELTVVTENGLIFTIREKKAQRPEEESKVTISTIRPTELAPMDFPLVQTAKPPPTTLKMERDYDRDEGIFGLIYDSTHREFYSPIELRNHVPQASMDCQRWIDRYSRWHDEVEEGGQKVSMLPPQDMVFWQLEGLLMAVGMCLESATINSIDFVLENDDFTCFSSGYQYPWQEHMEDDYGYGYYWEHNDDINRPQPKTIIITKPGICRALVDGIKHLDWLRINRKPKKYMEYERNDYYDVDNDDDCRWDYDFNGIEGYDC
ncbi:hypothetical protein BJ508DRAFT_377354 [Ascobolus immersus RN42]|uniref:Uncharacterized protein n=1 Tax=Ascobolus immersus RN42 TaxID=1160509 RepID=A0A3N4I3K1_ASCIM|nr:hypothetical protein BJ508DRAFT_377354 [Ascobolus immersus RN42]